MAVAGLVCNLQLSTTVRDISSNTFILSSNTWLFQLTVTKIIWKSIQNPPTLYYKAWTSSFIIANGIKSNINSEALVENRLESNGLPPSRLKKVKVSKDFILKNISLQICLMTGIYKININSMSMFLNKLMENIEICLFFSLLYFILKKC